MGKPTGFIEWGRQDAPKRAKQERLHDYRELVLPLAPEHAKAQAGRCMDCGVPFCHQGCPLGNQIPEFNELVYRNHWEAAFKTLSQTNNFPEFTGRLCPAPCESACVLGINQDPVTIEQMEKEIVERAFAEGWVRARPPSSRTGKVVAVVGSGPAGLAAAAQLNQAGHRVTVFERSDRLGGLLRYGIPDFKLEKQIIERRLELLSAEGVEFQTGVDVGGAGPSYRQMREQHDAVVLAMGARRARELEVPGRELTGVIQAMDFLEAQNRVVAGDRQDTPWNAAGKRVVILGGGDTGSDCLGTALRQGAASVTQIELLPAPPSDRTSDNPWPQWPMIFRTSSSQEEGGDREFGWMTQRLSGVEGRLTTLHAQSIHQARGADGRLSLVPSSDQETTREVDLLILALGFVGPETQALTEQLGMKLDSRGNVAADGQFRTSVDGVFSAGDVRRGASLIVWAISEGREAARAVDAYLQGEPSKLPTRGAHLPFGGR